MKKYIRNIVIALFFLVFISFIVFMLFFKQKPSLNENNRVKENNLIDANNVTNINNKDLLVFKDNFLKCNNSFLNNDGTTYNVIANKDETKCIISAVGITNGFVNSTSCFVPKSLLSEEYFNNFINDLSINKMEDNISKYKDCSFVKDTLPETNKNIEDFKNNFIKCNKALFFDLEKQVNYSVVDDSINKERCVFIFNTISSKDFKNNKTIVCNIEKKVLSLKLYDLIIDGIKNNKLNSIENVVCSEN